MIINQTIDCQVQTEIIIIHGKLRKSGGVIFFRYMRVNRSLFEMLARVGC
jgi:hypothetical protein